MDGYPPYTARASDLPPFEAWDSSRGVGFNLWVWRGQYTESQLSFSFVFTLLLKEQLKEHPNGKRAERLVKSGNVNRIASKKTPFRDPSLVSRIQCFFVASVALPPIRCDRY